jgi:uncharacterized protein YacL
VLPTPAKKTEKSFQEVVVWSDIILRIIGTIVLGVGGWRGGTYLVSQNLVGGYMPWGLVLTLVGCVLGLAITPYITILPLRRLLDYTERIPTPVFVSALLGLIAGLMIAALISIPFFRISGWLGWGIPAMLSLLLGFLGFVLGLQRDRDMGYVLPSTKRKVGGAGNADNRILVDTSAIIDGRIADLGKTGFVTGELTVPRFVLNELQHVADSSDSLRRARGRRGLEVLNRLRKEDDIPINIVDIDVPEDIEVDAKLVQLAIGWGVSILTTDFNLNRVAEIQGVQVLNINELANALKPIVLPGEEMTVHVIQDGKESGQGVGFLDDGTMVVVEGGRRYINTYLDVTVTRVLQTAAGRIIFAQPKVN